MPTAILVAAGRGRRFGGDRNKVLLRWAGKPIWQHAAETLIACDLFDRIVMVIHPDDRSEINESAGKLPLQLVEGGPQRADSVRLGFEHLERWAGDGREGWQEDLVAIHDAARPLVTPEEIRAVMETAKMRGAAILATPVRGTLKRADASGQIEATVNRDRLWEAQTPQVFRHAIYRAAILQDRVRASAKAIAEAPTDPVTDDAELVERAGFAVTLVPGSTENLKITHPDDLSIASAIAHRRSRTGFHPLSP